VQCTAQIRARRSRFRGTFTLCSSMQAFMRPQVTRRSNVAPDVRIGCGALMIGATFRLAHCRLAPKAVAPAGAVVLGGAAAWRQRGAES